MGQRGPCMGRGDTHKVSLHVPCHPPGFMQRLSTEFCCIRCTHNATGKAQGTSTHVTSLTEDTAADRDEATLSVRTGVCFEGRQKAMALSETGTTEDPHAIASTRVLLPCIGQPGTRKTMAPKERKGGRSHGSFPFGPSLHVRQGSGRGLHGTHAG